MTSVEDQQQFLLPLNRDTEKIYYNHRFIIDTKVLVNHRTWQITKVNRISPNGLIRFTLAQDLFNSETDYIETDENGNVIGMYADYWKKGVEPTTQPDEPVSIYSKVTYSGKDPVIKISGNYKKFTVKFYDEIGQIAHKHGFWKYEIDGENVGELIQTDDTNIDENQIKIKFIGSDDYIDKDLVVTYVSDSGITSSVIVNIQGL